MNNLDIAVFILFILFFILLVSTFVEFYKKKIRKDKAGIAEIKAISILSSALVTAILVYFHMYLPILGHLLMDAPIWVDHIGYFAAIYILQYVVDMKLIKAGIKSWLKRYGISEE